MLLLFSCQVMSDSSQLHGLLHARLFCPSLPSRVCSNSCQPLLILPSVFPSITVFSNESALWIRWPKYWSFSFSTKEYSGLISFRTDWLNLAVQGTLRSLLQHHNLKASILQCSAYFMVEHQYSYMTTEKHNSYTILALCLSLLYHHYSWPTPPSQQILDGAIKV